MASRRFHYYVRYRHDFVPPRRTTEPCRVSTELQALAVACLEKRASLLDKRRPAGLGRAESAVTSVPQAPEDASAGHCHINRVWRAARSWGLGARIRGMKKPPDPRYRHRFPAELISHAVWLYHVFSLSFRDVELLLSERGIVVSY
jgi:hypothetical protein